MALEQHPKIIRATQKITDALKRLPPRSRYSAPSVFLCGGYRSLNREALRTRLEGLAGADYGVFYAEVVWDALYDVIGANALRMEENLAALADVVVIIVESPGTFAELGAFSSSPTLRKKLLLVMEDEFEFKQSFLNTGPTRWVADDSYFGGPLWCSFPLDDLALDKISERLDSRRQKSGRPRDSGDTMRQALNRLCDTVYIGGPCTEATLEALLTEPIGAESGDALTLRTLLGVGQALGFIRCVSRSGRPNVYYRPIDAATPADLLYYQDLPNPDNSRI